jgi:hypothetical protein
MIAKMPTLASFEIFILLLLRVFYGVPCKITDKRGAMLRLWQKYRFNICKTNTKHPKLSCYLAVK